MVHSYKGGSGKTLFSSNFASIFANNFNKKALLIEGDLQGPVYSKIFADINPDMFLNNYLKSEIQDIKSYIYQTKYNFDIIFASPKFTLEDLINPDDYDTLLDKIRAVKQDIYDLDYDVIIIDLAPGVNYFAIASIILADHIIMILRPDQNAFEGIKTLLDIIYMNTVRKEKKQFHLVWSQIPSYPGFDLLINEWNGYLKHQYPFILTFNQLGFEPETSFNFVKHSMILPPTDPTREKLVALAEVFL